MFDNPPSAPLSPASMQKLQFSLDIFGGSRLVVNTDDLYVMRTKNTKDSWVILFNEANKIVSFIAMRKGSKVGLMQW